MLASGKILRHHIKTLMSKLSTQNENIAIGRRITAVRTATGMTQNEFAEHLGLSPRAYANYERGEREMPVALFKTLYETHHIDPVWILAGPGDEPIAVESRRIDGQLLEKIIEMVEEWLTKQRRTLKPEKKARVIRLAYEHCADQQGVDTAYLQDMLSLAA